MRAYADAVVNHMAGNGNDMYWDHRNPSGGSMKTTHGEGLRASTYRGLPYGFVINGRKRCKNRRC